MSPASKSSDWVEREILVAEDPDHKKPIFPVLLEGKVWSRLANIQYQDMQAGLNATLTPGFVQKLAGIVPRGNAAVTPPPLPGIPLPTTTQSQPRSRLSEGALVAIITGIFAVIVAVIGILPNLPPFAAQPTATIAATYTDSPSPTDTTISPTDTPAPSNTPIPTVVIQPSTTATIVYDLSVTQTEAILQRTADVIQQTNAAMFAESTQIAQTAAALAMPTRTNSPLPMQTPTAPITCEGTIVVSTGTDNSLNQVRSTPQRNAPPRPAVMQGATVTITAKQASNGEEWYQISYSSNRGWIPAEYVEPASNCL